MTWLVVAWIMFRYAALYSAAVLALSYVIYAKALGGQAPSQNVNHIDVLANITPTQEEE